MKKIIAFITTMILVAGFITARAQIYRVEVSDNYFVVTDTTTGTNVIDFVHPAWDLRYTESGTSYVNFFKTSSDQRVTGNKSYHLDSLVNSADEAFANIDSLRVFLRQNTGISPGGG